MKKVCILYGIHFLPPDPNKCSEVNLSIETIRFSSSKIKASFDGFSIHRINRIHWITDLILKEVYVEHFHF